MKTVANLAELHRQALAMGAEVVGPGMSFNTARQQVSARQRPTVVPLEAVPPPVPPITEAFPETMTRAQVETLLSARIEQALLAQSARFTEHMTSIIREVRQSKESGVSRPTEFNFDVTYDRDHAITSIKAKAKP